MLPLIFLTIVPRHICNLQASNDFPDTNFARHGQVQERKTELNIFRNFFRLKKLSISSLIPLTKDMMSYGKGRQ